MKKLVYSHSSGVLSYEDLRIHCTCTVRNELNSRRFLHNAGQVVYPIVKGEYYKKPYMPRVFPVGYWKVTEIEWTENPVFAPVKIKTNAKQQVQVWAVDKDGGYDFALDEYVTDEGYYFHHSNSSTTLGCIRIGTAQEAAEIAFMIETLLKKGETVAIEVQA